MRFKNRYLVYEIVSDLHFQNDFLCDENILWQLKSIMDQSLGIID